MFIEQASYHMTNGAVIIALMLLQLFFIKQKSELLFLTTYKKYELQHKPIF